MIKFTQIYKEEEKKKKTHMFRDLTQSDKSKLFISSRQRQLFVNILQNKRTPAWGCDLMKVTVGLQFF